MHALRIKTTRLGVGSGNHFLAITWKNGSEKDPRKGWLLQPCVRVQRGHWHYESPIAGPFRTKKTAREVKKYLESIDWKSVMSWIPSRGEER